MLAAVRINDATQRPKGSSYRSIENICSTSCSFDESRFAQLFEVVAHCCLGESYKRC